MFSYPKVEVNTHASHSISNETWPGGAMWRLPRLKAANRLRGFAARARGVLVLWDERRGFGKALAGAGRWPLTYFSMAVP